MLALVLAVVFAEPVALVASNPASVDSPAVAAAKAARARVTTRPESVPLPAARQKRIEAEIETRIAAARALGHHGQVVVEGIIGIDGRFTDLRVRTSSRADDLDAIALDNAGGTVFKPARDAGGAPLAIWGSMPFEVLPASFGMGTITGYRCDAFVRDMDWWRSVWPEREWKEHAFYSLVLGFETIGTISARGSGTAALEQIRTRAQSFPVRWTGTLDACRARPATLFVDALRKQNA